MTGPHPVVCIATVFPNAARRCTYQTYIFIRVVDEEVVFVIVKEAAYIPIMNGTFRCFFSQCITHFLRFCSALRFRHIICEFGHNFICYVLHTD